MDEFDKQHWAQLHAEAVAANAKLTALAEYFAAKYQIPQGATIQPNGDIVKPTEKTDANITTN